MKLTKQQKILLAKHGKARPAHYIASLKEEKKVRAKMRKKAYTKTRVWKRRFDKMYGQDLEHTPMYRRDADMADYDTSGGADPVYFWKEA